MTVMMISQMTILTIAVKATVKNMMTERKLENTVAHRCHGNILKHRRNHFTIKRQHAATYALGLHGHFESSRQQMRISRSGVASVDNWRGKYSYIRVHRP